MRTKVYFKPTDTHVLMHRTSYHPPHTFRGIIKSQILRFHRIYWKETDLHEAITVLFRSLRRWGYLRSFLRRVRRETLASLLPSPTRLSQTKGMSRSNVGTGQRLFETETWPPTELGAEDMVEEKLLLPFVCTFHRDYTSFLSGIQEHFRVMQPGWEVPSQARVIRAPMKNPSLGDILVRAKLEGRVRTPPEKLLCHLAHRHMVSNHVSCSFVRITYGHHDCCTGLYFFCKPASSL